MKPNLSQYGLFQGNGQQKEVVSRYKLKEPPGTQTTQFVVPQKRLSTPMMLVSDVQALLGELQEKTTLLQDLSNQDVSSQKENWQSHKHTKNTQPQQIIQKTQVENQYTYKPKILNLVPKRCPQVQTQKLSQKQLIKVITPEEFRNLRNIKSLNTQAQEELQRTLRRRTIFEKETEINVYPQNYESQTEIDVSQELFFTNQPQPPISLFHKALQKAPQPTREVKFIKVLGKVAEIEECQGVDLKTQEVVVYFRGSHLSNTKVAKLYEESKIQIE